MRRHQQSCSGKITLSSLHRERACLRCSSKKKRCGHERPSCKSCQQTGHPCQYPSAPRASAISSITQDSTVLIDSTRNVDSEVKATSTALRTFSAGYRAFAQWQHAAAVSQYDPARDAMFVTYIPNISPARSFTFLKHFTAQHNLTGCFWAKLVAHPGQLSSSDTSGSPSSSSPSSSGDNDSPSVHAKYESQEQSNISRCVPNSSLMEAAMNMPAYRKTWEIHSALQKSRGHDPNVIDQRCLDFFSPGAIDDALEIYWPIFQPNWPVMHRLTFKVETCPPTLLSILVMAGTSILNAQEAKYWAGFIEPLAFHELQMSLTSDDIYHRIQCIQATYLVTCHLVWEGDARERTRGVRRRHRSVIAAARALNMSRYKHDRFPSTFEEFDWEAWLRKEEIIRTLLWVFLLDTAFVVFNNSPPNFAVEDSTMGLIVPELCYQTASAKECFQILQSWQAIIGRPQDMSVFTLIKIFFKPDLSVTMINNLAHESFQNLWAVISSLHIILFQLNPRVDDTAQFDSLKVALNNWEAVYNQRLRNNDEKYFDAIVATAILNPDPEYRARSWKDVGFWGNAGEYWLLARVILDHMVTERESFIPTDEIPPLRISQDTKEPEASTEGETIGMDSMHSLLTVLEVNS